eukprot:s5763_g2.t1
MAPPLDLRGCESSTLMADDSYAVQTLASDVHRHPDFSVGTRAEMLDEPWHGNVLLSCGPHKLEPKQQLQEFNADLFCSSVIFCTWTFQAFNLYHADFWVIGPATADHGRGGCSYVELVATSAPMQRPLWFVSHAWLEPVAKFVASPLLLDVAATEDGRSHVITDGLAGLEQEMIPVGFLAKSQREAEFPIEILMRPGLEEGWDGLGPVGQNILMGYEAVGRALAGHFALANWFSSVANGLGTSRLLTALQNDEKRRKFDYVQLRRFLQHLPPQLQVLRLDLGFTAVQLVELDAPLSELQELSLRLIKMPLRQVNLQRSMLPKLRLSVKRMAEFWGRSSIGFAKFAEMTTVGKLLSYGFTRL